VIWVVGGFAFLALILIGFAVCMRPNVKASINFWRIGFSLEAKNEEPNPPKLPS